MKAAGIKEKHNSVILSISLRHCCYQARGERDNEPGGRGHVKIKQNTSQEMVENAKDCHYVHYHSSCEDYLQ